MPICSLLLVDDNESFHHLFRRYLSGRPYALESAFDYQTGLDLAQRMRPDSIILDIMMPQRDGWEVLRALQQDESTREIPVIICSVLDQRAVARSLGVHAYIKKPVTKDALLTALGELCLECSAGQLAHNEL